MMDSDSAGAATRFRRWSALCTDTINRASALLVCGAILAALTVGFLLVRVPPPPRPYPKPAPPVPDFSAESIPAQHSREAKPATGKLLIAGQRLRDSNFAETVILLLRYDPAGAMGVIINRALKVKLSEILPKFPGLENRSDTIFHGGPVERTEILMLVRTKDRPENSRQIFGDIYLSESADLLKRLTADRPQTTLFRIYSGYAGWAPNQLEAEVSEGAWHIFSATADNVFAKNPEDLWQQFIDRATIRLAQRPNPTVSQSSAR